MARNIIVEDESNSEEMAEHTLSSAEQTIISWVMDKAKTARDYRDLNFRDKWEEYYRLWRGIHSPSDKNHNTERSKLINPALQQAIEVAVAEQEEAVFGRGKWFDVEDDYLDKQDIEALTDVYYVRELLHEDLAKDKAQMAISESMLNGALYGNGIAKIIIEEKQEASLSQQGGISLVNNLHVYPVPVSNLSFFIDPSARNIDESMYCGEDIYVPSHTIIAKIQSGEYRKVSIGSGVEDENTAGLGELKSHVNPDSSKVTEYHGLIPKTYLLNLETEDSLGRDEELIDIQFDENDLEDVEMVEAIITIANDTALLKAVENPLWFKDRAYVSYAHDIVPDRFYGRGVAEKGYNPQKALDAELRGRIDAMALTIHPMMGADVTRLSFKGTGLTVSPGKTVFTNGKPSDVLEPFNFGNISPTTFTQSGEFERMIQMATGSMDSATPVGVNSRNSTASGMSMILSGMIKRSKRTLRNIESTFILPLINKVLWRYMQFDPDRYKFVDLTFTANSTLGIMARELEQQQNTQLLNTVPPDSPAYWMLIKNIYDNSTIANKETMLTLVNQMLQKTMNPQPDPMQQQLQQMELEKLKSEIEYIKAQSFQAISNGKASMSNAQPSQADNIAKAKIEVYKADKTFEGSLRTAELKATSEISKTRIMSETQLELERIKLQESILKNSETAQVEEPDGPKNISILRDESGKISGAQVN